MEKVWIYTISIITAIAIIIGITALNFIPSDQNPDTNPDQDPATLTEIAQIRDDGQVMRVQVHNNIAFVLDTDGSYPGGLMAIDISDPYTPTHIGYYYDTGALLEFVIQGDLAYVANMFNGLEILDISDLESITRIGHYLPGETVYDLKVAGDLVFLGAASRGLEIVDVSDPTNPVMVSSTSLSGLGIKLELVDDVCYITDHVSSYTNIEAYDLSNPVSPQYLGGYIVYNVDFFNLHINDNVLYASDHGSSGDVFILDIENPSAIGKLAQFDTGGTAYGTYVQDNIAYFTDYDKGLLLVDISDLNNPVLIESHDDGGAGQGVFVVGEFIYFANRNDGLEILRYS